MDSLPSLKIIRRWRKWWKSKHFARDSISTRYALVEACLIGIFSALAALLLKEGINFLGTYRLQIANRWGAIYVLPLFGLVLGAIAGLFVEYVSPSAAGGGVPQVKAALNRLKIPLSLRVAIVKIIGTILVLGAGIPLGRRAPTIHIGAALAGELTRFVPTSPEHRRQMIAAGAAAGLAAGFNTPIAGVMFVVEELMRDVSNLTLEIAIVASFTGAVVSLLLESSILEVTKQIVDVESFNFIPNDIPFYILLGIIAGVLGAFFNRSVLLSVKWNEKLNLPLAVRIGLAGLISGLVMAFLPSFFRDNAGLREFLIRGELSTQETALVLVAHYVLTIIAAGCRAPGGVFAPALVMGSALGYLFGDAYNFIFGTEATGTFALVGMGALFTGIVRVPITAIMIIFEFSTNFNIVLPLMITCAIAYISAETVERGSLYKYLLSNMGIELEEEELRSDTFLGHLKASDVMQSQVETTTSDVWVSDLLQLMTTSHHRGFPVMEQGRLVGIVTQSDLVKVSTGKTQVKVGEIMTKNPIVISAQANLTDVLYLLNRYQLSRLPVIENNRLVGIITRTDIIRVEVNELKAESPVLSSSYYLIYQTSSPATGKGCILVPISEDDDFRGLFKIAVGLARYYQYELEFVRVIKIPQHQAPYRTKVDSSSARHTMHILERMGRKANIPVHTKIIVSHQRTAVLLETIKNRHINLVIMGWKQKSHSQEFIFSHVIDSLINKAPCELILVKLGKNKQHYPYQNQAQGSCIIPISGGPNIQEGLKLLPAFFKIYQSAKLPPVWLTKVYRQDEQELNLTDLHSAAHKLNDLVTTDVHLLPLCSDSVVSAIVQTAEIYNSELVIVGASREGLLKQAWYGNIPEQIANKLDSTVIIIRLPS